jgi:drug/metabolite transporter (DMT)-like permease
MRVIDYGRLLLLAALWGASFLFMRITTPAFGANSAFLRVLFAAIALGLLLGVQGKWSGYQGKFISTLQLGVINSGLPFSCTALPRNGCRQGTPPRLTPRRR